MTVSASMPAGSRSIQTSCTSDTSTHPSHASTLHAPIDYNEDSNVTAIMYADDLCVIGSNPTRIHRSYQAILAALARIRVTCQRSHK